MASTTKRIPESEWDQHRAEIERLYCDENQTLKQVQRIMQEQHNFSASKWQYEAHFKYRKLRKNHFQATWSQWNRDTDSGEISGPIVFNGRELSKAKVRKARARYRRSQIPKVVKEAPPAAPFTSSSESSSSDVMSIPRAQLWPNSGTPSLHSLAFYLNCMDFSLDPTQVASILDAAMTDLKRTILKAPYWFRRNKFVMRLTNGDDAQYLTLINRRIDTRSTHPRSALQVLYNIWGDRLLRPKAVHQISRLSVLDQARLHLLAHALSNNMFDQLGFDNLGKLWKHLRQEFGRRFQQSLAQIASALTSRELVWKFLQAAIEEGDAAGVKVLIRTCRVNINDVVCIGAQCEPLSAVEVAAGLMHSSVLRVLIEEGADVNLTGKFTQAKETIETGGALYWLFKSPDMSLLLSRKDVVLSYSQACHSTPSPSDAVDVLNQLATAGLKDTSERTRMALQGGYKSKAVVKDDKNFWAADELKQLAAIVASTDLFWVFGYTLQDILGNCHVSDDFVTSLADWCCPEDRTGDNNGVLIDRDHLLEIMVSGHHIFGTNYLLARGAKLIAPRERCCGGGTKSSCLQRMSKKSDDQSSRPSRRLPQLQGKRAERHFEQLKKSVFQAPNPYSFNIQLLLNQNPRRFWKVLLRKHQDYDWLSGEDRLLRIALQLRDDQFARELLSLRQDILPSDLDIIKAAHSRRDLGIWDMTIRLLERETLAAAISKKDILALDAMVATGTCLKDKYGHLRRAACETGDPVVLQRCLELVFHPPSDGFRSDDHAREIQDNNDAIENILISHTSGGIQLYHRNNVKDALIYATHKGKAEGVRQLLTTELDFYTPYKVSRSSRRHDSLLKRLLYAFPLSNPDTIELVLKTCCAITSIDRGFEEGTTMFDSSPSSSTPMLVAIERNSLRLVQTLVRDFNADVNLPATNGRRRTPLQKAAEHGNYDIFEFLLLQGASVNNPINQRGGATALQLAAIGGYCGIMEILINKEADLDAPGAVLDGRTALEGAAEHGRLDAVKLLLDSGVSTTGKGRKSFRRAREYAKEEGHIGVMDFLDDYEKGMRLAAVWESDEADVMDTDEASEAESETDSDSDD